MRAIRYGPIGLVATALVGCGGGDSVQPGPEVASLTVTPLQAIVSVGERVTATAVARTTLGEVASVAIDWRTSDPAVAAVTSSGTISAAANGTASITAIAGRVSA